MSQPRREGHVGPWVPGRRCPARRAEPSVERSQRVATRSPPLEPPACTTRRASGHQAVTRADEPNVAERATPPSRRQFRNSTATWVKAGGAAGNRTGLKKLFELRKCWESRRDTTTKYAKRPADTPKVLMASTPGERGIPTHRGHYVRRLMCGAKVIRTPAATWENTV